MRSADPSALSPRDIVASGLCIGCGACAAAADRPARMRWDRYGQLKPEGPAEWYRRPDPAFAAICPFSPAAADETRLAEALFPGAAHRDERISRFEAAYVGHVAEEPFRAAGSSGGMVSWVAAELLRRGLVDAVLHVGPDDPRSGRLFSYRVSRTAPEVMAGARSRYYPVDLADVLRQVRAEEGRFAVVGVPCFIKAVHLLCRRDEILNRRIAFTLGLFCGHMKSARMVDSFAWQMGLAAEDVAAAEFRLKNPRRPASWYTAHLTARDGSSRSRDWWHLADGDWGAGFFQNSACNYCDDVVAETADISFGDAWVEPYSSDGRGTNVVVVRSVLLHLMLEEAVARGRLVLRGADAAFVAETQAAGLRHRREGLALRLALRRFGLRPRKRVAAGLPKAGARRALVYLSRLWISAASHRVFWAARVLRWPGFYIRWARGALSLYQGLAYSRGPVGRLADRLSSGRRTS